jgi:hypothetical protein
MTCLSWSLLWGMLPLPGQIPPQGQTAFNPAISVVGDFGGALWSKDGDQRLRLREMEVAFAADVDPFLRVEAFAAIHDEEGESVTEVEEAFGIYSNLGKGFQAKFGKIAGAIGRANRFHRDELVYIEYPLVIKTYLGEEGLRAPGGSLSYLFPGRQFHEITLEALDPMESPFFTTEGTKKPLYVARYRTFFDFTEDWSAQIGASYVDGPFDSSRTRLFGVDFAGRWTPGTAWRSALIEGEAYWLKVGGTGETVFGGFLGAQYQIIPRWFLAGRWDTVELPGGGTRQGYTLGLTLKVTEFEHWRLEYENFSGAGEPRTQRVNFQFQWVLGPHPIHKY